VPTTLLLPAVLDAVDIPVVAAGGFYDGRGLAAALSYGAAGIGMGTRFLLTSDSAVPERIRREYLGFGLDGTVVTSKADGMPHRLLRTRFVNGLDTENRLTGLFRTARRTAQFRRLAELSWPALLRDGLAMKKAGGRSWAQLVLAANTPMLLRAGLVDGDTDAGMLASGQVVGLIDDLPSCAELVDRIVADAVAQLARAQATISPTKHLFGNVGPSDPEDQ
jgi:NAD(P)H-dependent flavin oxidoreductase YrpB (nitropropane dioxygenase family)